MRGPTLFSALVLVFAHLACAEPSFPPLTGRVVDEAQILSSEAIQELTTISETLENQTTHQLVIATRADLKDVPLEDYGHQLGRHWQIGQKEKNNGVMGGFNCEVEHPD